MRKLLKVIIVVFYIMCVYGGGEKQTKIRPEEQSEVK